MKRTLLAALLVATAVALEGCAQEEFAGSARKGGGTHAAGGDAPTPPSAAEGQNAGGDKAGNDAAVAKCLASWGGTNPFGAQPAYRTMGAAVQVFGVGKGLVDDAATDRPALILISAAVSVLGKTTYELHNPNGWYCIKADVNVLTGLTVELACTARLADSKVDVGVLANAQPVSEVGVHVLSHVAVRRVGGACQ